MKKALIVGSGAAGAMAAYTLKDGFEVVLCEAGGTFHPFSGNIELLGMLRYGGLFFDEREFSLFFPPIKIRKTEDKNVLVRCSCIGGTTTIATANAIRCDRDLRAIGIDLDEEFDAVNRLVPITADHRKQWKKITKTLFSICEEKGLAPVPMPKAGAYASCRRCGRCVMGCPYGVKWDARTLVQAAIDHGVHLLSRHTVERLDIQNGIVRGVHVKHGFRRLYIPADIVVLAAGGLSTPVILQNSGIPCENKLFVDPVLCVAAPFPGAGQDWEIPMPFLVQKDRFIISPYFDYVSFFFNKQWGFPARNIVSLMIKLADTNTGSVLGSVVNKCLTGADLKTLNEAVSLCKNILAGLGIDRREMFLGTLNSGHPGGMLPLTAKQQRTLHHDQLPSNCYVADTSLFPQSPGKPPILTVMALAQKVGKEILRMWQ